jgi:hypothetical protein
MTSGLPLFLLPICCRFCVAAKLPLMMILLPLLLPPLPLLLLLLLLN